MADKKTKLELTWVGKDEPRPRLEPRILLENVGLSHGVPGSENMVIHGDNLLALRALEQTFTGRVKCVYIDPPYNTNAAVGAHYDDGIEHSIWLTMMRERLSILWKLLTTANGTLLISINDDEMCYLKVLCDELFGRAAFVATLIWNYEGNTDNQAKIIRYHEYILVYSRTGDIDNPRVLDPSVKEGSKLLMPEIRNTIVKNGPKNPPKSVRIPLGMPASFQSGRIVAARAGYPRYDVDVLVEDGRTVNQVVATTGWSSREIFEEFLSGGFSPVKDSKGQETVFELRPSGAIEAVKTRVQDKGHFVSVLRGFGTTNQMRLMLEKLGLRFAYPKPVNLLSYLISAFSGPDDIVLDSFAGSGTSGHAVMDANRTTGGRRKFILVELNEQTMLDITLPRLRAVVDGDSAAEIPRHGGGFRCYRLAPSLLEKDTWGNYVIAEAYRNGPDAGARLAEAMCKLEGFTYAPSQELYWIHGQSTETAYIYVTTQTMPADRLRALNDEVGSDRSLRVCCGAWQGSPADFPNLILQKIPSALLSRFEWGRDDYSLNVAAVMPQPEPDPANSHRRALRQSSKQLPLLSTPEPE